MKLFLDRYVGRTVRLSQKAFGKISRRGEKNRADSENRFLVASIDGSKHKLICYGARQRIIVAPSDVVLI